MKNKLNFVASGAIFTIALSTIATPALAENTAPQDPQPKPYDVDTSQNTSEDTTAKFQAYIVITSSTGSQIIDVDTANQKLANILASKDLTIENYRNADNTAVNAEQVIENGQNIILYRSEFTGTSEIIPMKAPEITEESPELYQGETKVVAEGVDGEALKTVISTNNLSTNKEVNATAVEGANANTTNEKLTIIKAPVAKVTMVGTATRPTLQNSDTIAETEDEGEALQTTGRNSSSDNSSANSTTNTSAPIPVVKTQSGQPADVTKRSQAVDIALSRVGKPYVWAATGSDSFDCSGLINWTYEKNLGIDIPRTANQIGQASTPIDIKDLQPGDILWSSSHIVMYIGDGKVVHASSSRHRVLVDPADWFIKDGFKAGRIS